MVKTIVQPMPLENYLKEIPLRPDFEVEIDVPILNLPSLPGDETASNPASEAGAAGMLQVGEAKLE